MSNTSEQSAAAERPLSMRLLLRIYSSLGHYKWLVFLGNMLVIICVYADMTIIHEVKKLIDRKDLTTAPLWALISPFVILAVINRVAGGTQFLITAWGANRAAAGLRKQFYDRLLSLSKGFYDHHKAGWLVARGTGDLQIISDFMTFSLMLFCSMMTVLVLALVRIAGISLILLAPCVLTLPLFIAIGAWYKKRMTRTQRRAREQNSRMVANLTENIRGVRVVKAFGRENRNLRLFNRLNLLNRNVEVKAARLNALFLPSMDFFGILNMTLVVLFGSWLMLPEQAHLLKDPLTPGDLASYILYMNALVWPTRMCVELFSISLRACAGAERIYEIIDMKPEIKDSPNAVMQGTIQGKIEFEDVCFSYPLHHQDFLHYLDLTINPGETVALVGETGAGKTTLASLIARFYDVKSGRILIDDKNIRSYPLDELHQNLGIVLQDGFLFSGTVMDNLKFRRPDASDEDIMQLTKQLGIHEELRKLPGGYQTEIKEGGRSISEGQRQLISVARALIADPKILILDESTSSLDLYTERILQQAIDQLITGRTTIIIAHRLATVRKADRIIVMDHGRIVEAGSHEELMKKGDRYFRFVLQNESSGKLPE